MQKRNFQKADPDLRNKSKNVSDLKNKIIVAKIEK